MAPPRSRPSPAPPRSGPAPPRPRARPGPAPDKRSAGADGVGPGWGRAASGVGTQGPVETRYVRWPLHSGVRIVSFSLLALARRLCGLCFPLCRFWEERKVRAPSGAWPTGDLGARPMRRLRLEPAGRIASIYLRLLNSSGSFYNILDKSVIILPSVVPAGRAARSSRACPGPAFPIGAVPGRAQPGARRPAVLWTGSC